MQAYLITNTINGKKYVGICLNATRRWNRHKQAARNRPEQLVHRAISKYGIENFTFEIVACAPSWQDLLAVERLLIAQHGSFFRAGSGYNMTLGGEGCVGRVVSQAMREA